MAQEVFSVSYLYILFSFYVQFIHQSYSFAPAANYGVFLYICFTWGKSVFSFEIITHKHLGIIKTFFGPFKVSKIYFLEYNKTTSATCCFIMKPE